VQETRPLVHKSHLGLRVEVDTANEFVNLTLKAGLLETLPLSVEVDIPQEALLNSKSALERIAKKNWYLVTAEGEHRQWNRDRHIDSNLPDVDLGLDQKSLRMTESSSRSSHLKFTRSSSRLREACSAVAIPVVVDDFDRIVQVVDRQDDQNRTEYLFPIESSVHEKKVNVTTY
jgi:hypothetical protein